MSLRTYRVTVRGVFDGLDDAHAAGQLAAMERLDAAGLGYRGLRSAVTCTGDVRIRRR
jgi:hypothetical protein